MARHAGIDLRNKMSEHPGSKMQHTAGESNSKEMHVFDLLVMLARRTKKTGKQRAIDLKVNDV
jgi:hypothetical protein